MGTVSRLPSPAGGNGTRMSMTPGIPANRQPAMLTFLGLASFVCGMTAGVKIELVGDLYLLEFLIVLLVSQCVFSRGMGKAFAPSVFLGFVVAGALTFFGYLLSDLIAVSESWQYLKGWGRVALLIVDSAVLIVLAAHGRQNIWWLALGIGAGGIVALAIDGVPLTKWKLGYGEYVTILVVALAPVLPSFLASVAVAAFGVACVLADYRSIGAACLAVAAIMLWQSMKTNGSAKRGLAVALIAGVAIISVVALLSLTQDEYSERRQQSNVGRYVGLVVAWRAISESPLIGYGSWAADERFGRMYKAEVDRIDHDARRFAEVNRSLLPHSQFLQAWIEGGILGVAFFLLYGIGIVRAIHWFALQRKPDPLAPLFLFLLIAGFWNLLASPFLGIMRIYIALAVAIIAIAAHERRSGLPGLTGER